MTHRFRVLIVDDDSVVRRWRSWAKRPMVKRGCGWPGRPVRTPSLLTGDGRSVARPREELRPRG